MKIVWYSIAIASLILGAIGIFLPLLPTVPFLLLAAFCFARSSQKAHDWLIEQPTFGPPIKDWQKSGAIRPRAKIAATATILLALGLSVIFGVSGRIIWIQVGVLTLVLTFIWSRPSA